MEKKQITKIKITALLSGCFLGAALFLSGANTALADSEAISLRLGEREIKRGYTIDKPDGLMLLAVFPDVLDRTAQITLRKVSAKGLPEPEDLKRVSEVFEFDIITDPIKIFAKEVIVVLNFESDNQKTKKIYLYDGNQDKWRPLFSLTNYADKWVRAYTHLPYSKIAVFEDDKSEEGYASRYRSSRYPYGCASNDYPFDTRLKVTSLEDGKSVVCQVKSTGPFVTGRIIDLSLTAFRDLAPSWQGVIKVRVEAAEENTLATAEAGPARENEPAVQGISAPALNAPVAMIYDADNRRVVYEKNSYRQRSVASITKLMTAIVFLETSPDFDRVITIESADLPLPEPGVRIAVSPGDQITVRDLFNAMLTGSANNAALALVRSTGMSVEEFVAKMNNKAGQLDMMSTSFADPTGLAVGNKSTTTDIALLTNYIMGRPGVRSSSLQRTYTYTIINKNEARTIHNPLFLNNNTLVGQPLVGAKTGFINEAGYCLVTKIRHSSGREYVAVVLGSTSAYNRTNDMKKLIEYGQEIF